MRTRNILDKSGPTLVDAASQESRGISLEAWVSRGLFPDLSLRLRRVRVSEWLRAGGGSQADPQLQEVAIRSDSDVFATPPRSLEPRCFGCHFEQGVASLPWWRDREKLCPACTVIATAGRRPSEHALEGATELFAGFGVHVLGASQKDAFGTHGCTIYLDGSGVGSRMFHCGSWERMAVSRDVEDEVRRRYGAGVRRVGEAWRRASRMPWTGGRDVQVDRCSEVVGADEDACEFLVVVLRTDVETVYVPVGGASRHLQPLFEQGSTLHLQLNGDAAWRHKVVNGLRIHGLRSDSSGMGTPVSVYPVSECDRVVTKESGPKAGSLPAGERLGGDSSRQAL